MLKMKVSNIISLMYSGDRVKVFSKSLKTIFEGIAQEVPEGVQELEVVQIWSRDKELIMFVD